MTTAVFDCFSGIAGDMTLAALVDAGAPLHEIVDGLRRLDLPPFDLAIEDVWRAGMRAKYLRVTVSEERTYQPPEMRAMVSAAGLPQRVTERTIAAIDALEAGERAAHATQTVHLHEAGGVDAMIDLTGAMIALELLDVYRGVCPVITVGAATITRSSHGALPAAPGPAAAHILQRAGFALRFVEASHELVTPSGAAILAAVAEPGSAVVTPVRHGCGAGTMDPPGRPNAVRIFIGNESPPVDAHGLRHLVQLEANIDDMLPTLLAHARDRLLAEGALDAWLEPIGMKKGRLATKLCALVSADDESRFAELILRETTSLGVRVTAYRRYERARRVETVATGLGMVRVKLSDNGRPLPEFEDVAALAATSGRPAIDIQRQLERELGERR
ncbi:MAG: LarC family nickel insertion protein [Dehalococcoidia bacterium]